MVIRPKKHWEDIFGILADCLDEVVGAYVGKTNGNGFGNNMSSFNDLSVNNHPFSGASALTINGPAYMLTVQNKSLPMTTITASYYDVAQVQAASNEGASIVWENLFWNHNL